MATQLSAALVTSILSHTVNSVLRYDPGSRHRLAKLSGKILRISSTSPSVTLFICPTSEGVDFLDFSERTPDTILSGEFVNLVELLTREGHTLADTKVEVIGDINLLKEVREIALDADIDWEEPLNAVLGAVPGHQLAELLRGTFTWANTARTKTTQYISEYLTEELRMIPSEPELQDFHSRVDNLRSDTERLEARIKALASSLKREQK